MTPAYTIQYQLRKRCTHRFVCLHIYIYMLAKYHREKKYTFYLLFYLWFLRTYTANCENLLTPATATVPNIKGKGIDG